MGQIPLISFIFPKMLQVDLDESNPKKYKQKI